MSPRFSIGIDLGTTNSALAYLDRNSPNSQTQIFAVDQWESIGSLKAREILPSAIYLPPLSEQDGRFNLSFQQSKHPARSVVGHLARSQADYGGERVIQSSKSWLCNPAIDPDSKILPWMSQEVIDQKISPVQAATFLLEHFKDAWNFQFAAQADSRFEKQDICITVPASFDEVGQRLTLQAALAAGYPDSTSLLEEPQAAFYYWLQKHRNFSQLKNYFPIQNQQKIYRVLVADVGGGTTDFTLFEMVFSVEGKAPTIERIAVSDHVLLGGDNIDLTLALFLEPKLVTKGKLARSAWNQLVMQCRSIKERALSESPAAKDWHLSVAASGAKLFSATQSASISDSELREIIVDGFFPEVPADVRPNSSTSGLRELGLPYATDSAITRYLAAFLRGREVDAVLCNGGALKPDFLQQRIQKILGSWQPQKVPNLLPSSDMDLAVAHGAAWYGHIRTESDGRILAGYPHTILLRISSGNSEQKLLCILPRGAQPGSHFKIEKHRFQMLLNQPIAFSLFRSSQDYSGSALQVGDLIELQETGLTALPQMQVRFSSGQRKTQQTQVQLIVELSETGLLRLFCETCDSLQVPNKRWELQFNLRKEVSESESQKVDVADWGVESSRVKQALELISLVYGKAVSGAIAHSPKGLIRELERILGKEKSEWNIGLLRVLWTALAAGITKRSRSLAHEVSWLALSGFVLRPGYGAEMDRFYIAELWRTFELGLYFPQERRCWTEWWILWRRVSAGLSTAQQVAIFDQTFNKIQSNKEGSAEAYRLLASLERIDVSRKQRFVEFLLRRVEQHNPQRSAILYALGRIGSRVPFYAGQGEVVPAVWIEQWFEKLGKYDWSDETWRPCVSLFSQACRLVAVRGLEVSEQLRLDVLKKLQKAGADVRYCKPLEEYVAPDTALRVAQFGEALPEGLKLVDAGKVA